MPHIGSNWVGTRFEPFAFRKHLVDDWARITGRKTGGSAVEIRRGLYVVWRGKEYMADSDGKHHFILYSQCPVAGFQPGCSCEWRKRVSSAGVEDAYIVSPQARYKGHVFSIARVKDNLVLLGTGSRPPEDLGFARTEPGFYEKWVPIAEVESWEKKERFKWGG